MLFAYGPCLRRQQNTSPYIYTRVYSCCPSEEQKKNVLKESAFSKISLSSVFGAIGGHLSARLFDWYRTVLYNKEQKKRFKKDIKEANAKLMLYVGTGIFEFVGAVVVGIFLAVYLSTKQDNLNNEISKIIKEKIKLINTKAVHLCLCLMTLKKLTIKIKTSLT